MTIASSTVRLFVDIYMAVIVVSFEEAATMAGSCNGV